MKRTTVNIPQSDIESARKLAEKLRRFDMLPLIGLGEKATQGKVMQTAIHVGLYLLSRVNRHPEVVQIFIEDAGYQLTEGKLKAKKKV